MPGINNITGSLHHLVKSDSILNLLLIGPICNRLISHLGIKHDHSRIIVFPEYGRLGNQFFQLSYLYQLTNSSTKVYLIIFGMSDLTDMEPALNSLPRIKFVSIPSKSIFRCLSLIFRRLPLLAGARLQNDPHIKAIEQRDFTIITNSYYQTMQHVKPYLLQNLARRMYLREKGLAIAERIGISIHDTCFIHVRLGDASYWPEHLGGSVLHSTYFYQAMREIKDKLSSVRFIILTDSPDLASEIVPNIPILTSSSHEAFMLMHVMRYGIISASTFSLAAAISSSSNPYIIAPYFWAGHNGREWYPPDVYRSPDIHYIDYHAN